MFMMVVSISTIVSLAERLLLTCRRLKISGINRPRIPGSARLFARIVRFLAGNRSRDPRPVSAAVIGADHLDPIRIQPQRDRAAPPIVDAVDDGDLLAASEAGRHLADDRVDRVASRRQALLVGDDRDGLAARGVAAAAFGAIEALGGAAARRPRQKLCAGFLGE